MSSHNNESNNMMLVVRPLSLAVALAMSSLAHADDAGQSAAAASAARGAPTYPAHMPAEASPPSACAFPPASIAKMSCAI